MRLFSDVAGQPDLFSVFFCDNINITCNESGIFDTNTVKGGSGVRELLRELFVSHYGEVYAYLYCLSRDAALSEDLASEVFLEAVRSIHRFRGESDVRTWLFSIARHRWFGYLRRKKRDPQTEPLEDRYIPTGQTPESELLRREIAKRITELLSEEPERTRQIVQMRLEGYSFHEIGKKTGISENSARVIDYRAKVRIRRTLEKEGFCDE